MEEKTTKGLKEQRERRKRINCMKMGIITSIFVWMLISIILCVVLLCRVISLQNQIDRLVSSGIVSGQVISQTPVGGASVKELSCGAAYRNIML